MSKCFKYVLSYTINRDYSDGIMRTLKMGKAGGAKAMAGAALAVFAFGTMTPLLGGESRCDSVFEKLALMTSIATRGEYDNRGVDSLRAATLAATLTRNAGTTRLWAEGKCDSMIATLDTMISILNQDRKCDEEVDSIGLKLTALRCETSMLGVDASALQTEYNAKYEAYVAGKIPEGTMLVYARGVQSKLDSLKKHYSNKLGEMLKLNGKIGEVRKTKEELSARLQKIAEEQGEKAR